METISSFFKTGFGVGAEQLSLWQMLARCVVIYLFGIALVRFGKKRFLGKITAFDTIIAIIIGSLLSHAITDADYFIEILTAALLLILLHRLFSKIAAHSHSFGTLIKGHDRVIIRDGELLRDAMHRSNLSEQDVMQVIHQNAQTDDVSKIKVARLERNGDVSVILKEGVG